MFPMICWSISFAILLTYIISTQVIECKTNASNLSCLSETWYRGYPFTLFCCSCGFTLLPCWLEHSPENYLFLAFLSTVFFMSIGLFPRYLENKIHKIVTYCCSILSAFWIILSGNYEFFLMFGLLTYLLKKLKNETLWSVEVGALISMYFCLL